MKLDTSVPDHRERRRVDGVHVFYAYAPLSDEHVERGHTLRTLRVERGLSLRDAAQLFGIRPVELGECERGERDFDLRRARYLLDQPLPVR